MDMSKDNYKFGRYLNANQETRWATIDEIKRSGTYIDLGGDDYPVAGLPLLSNGKIDAVNLKKIMNERAFAVRDAEKQ